MSKTLWITSFRPFGISKNNDYIQLNFINHIKALGKNITLSVSQFKERGVRKFLDKQKINYKFFEHKKKELGNSNRKYSNHIMLIDALKEFLKNDYEYLAFSTVDISFGNHLFEALKKIKQKNFCALIFPNIQIVNGVVDSLNWPHFGIDLFIFKINKAQANIILKKIINNEYQQYDWGIIEHFYICICEILNINIYNIYKDISVFKYLNTFKDFNENRNWQIKKWKENQLFFINFLKKNNLSTLYAKGSYYFILYKILNFRDLNFKLILTYLKFYIYFPILKFMSLLKIK